MSKQKQPYPDGRREDAEGDVLASRPGAPLDQPAAYAESSRAGQHEFDREAEGSRTLELREEELVAHKELRELGEVEVRTEIEEVPGRLEVEAYREEVDIEHEPVGQVVSERGQSWEEGGVLIVPIYEEQLVVTKRLVLRERLRIRRVGTTERQLFEDTLRRERLVVDDPQHTGLFHERYPTGDLAGERSPENGAGQDEHAEREDRPAGGFLSNLARKALE